LFANVQVEGKRVSERADAHTRQSLASRFIMFRGKRRREAIKGLAAINAKLACGSAFHHSIGAGFRCPPRG
jgi:hypothetical protein